MWTRRLGSCGTSWPEQVRDECEGVGVGGVERQWRTMDAHHPVEAVRGDGQGPVSRQPQPSLVVPEGVLVGDELHAAPPAVGVEGVQVLDGEGIGVAPDVLVAHEGEGVFHVQLEVVDLPARQPVHEGDQGAQLRHAVRDTSSITPRTAKSGQSSMRQAGRAPSLAPLGALAPWRS